MSGLNTILKDIAGWDGESKPKYEDWMADIEHPISKDQMPDVGMAELISLMNIVGKMYTEQSCMHDPSISFIVIDDEWFTDKALPILLAINNDDFIIRLSKIYFGAKWDVDGRDHHWMLGLASDSGWYEMKKTVITWYQAVYNAFLEIQDVNNA